MAMYVHIHICSMYVGGIHAGNIYMYVCVYILAPVRASLNLDRGGLTQVACLWHPDFPVSKGEFYKTWTVELDNQTQGLRILYPGPGIAVRGAPCLGKGASL